MKNHITKNSLIVLVILLLIGVSILPTINQSVVKASINDDLIEVTTQACGIQGYKDTTVKLTREQYQDLEHSITEFKEKLYQTTKRGEIKKIYNEFIVELDKYGLLGRLSVKQAQYLASSLSLNTDINKYLERMLHKIKGLTLDNSNFFCSIYGEIQNTIYFQGPIFQLPSRIFGILSGGLGFVSILLELLGLLFIPLSLYLATEINPLHIFSTIFYGCYHYNSLVGGGWIEPASGSVWTFGLCGAKQWNGSFVGRIPTIAYLHTAFLVFNYNFLPGAIGFIGLRINSDSTHFYFGSALWTKISYVEN